VNPRILQYDIETRPAKGYFWDKPYETNILRTIEHPAMLSFAYKWFGEHTTYVKALPDYPLYKRDKYDDKFLVKDLHALVSEADILVAHNGDKYDITFSNTRFIFHGFDPPAPYKTIDTLKIARQKFKFLSNKLDDLADFLKVGRKVKTGGKDLWFNCMAGDMDAWETMKRYNKQDVNLLEAVYIKLRPWAKTLPNMGLWRDTPVCPKCGSKDIQLRGFYANGTTQYRRFSCNKCGGWSRSTFNLQSVKPLVSV